MKTSKILFSVLLAGTIFISTIVADNELVNISLSQGQLLGNKEISRGGRDFYEFKGIPYGKIVERFQPPKPADDWKSIKNATVFGNKCAQYDCYSASYVGEEDCLNINVWTPKLPQPGKPTILLPVVVILHLGNHFFGSSEMYGPHYFMDEDVVVITLNSRLGPFGYLNIGHKSAPGNMGLLDQTLALNWVRDNVAHFGGDWERVTLMGSGSGGTDVLLHLLNRGSTGLFHRAIISSANLGSCSYSRDPESNAKKLGEQVGCPFSGSSTNSAEFVECLKKLEPLELLKKMKKPDAAFADGIVNLEGFQDFAIFGPSVDSKGAGLSGVISDDPLKLIMDGKIVNKVPILIGSTLMEGLDPMSGMFLNDTKLFNDMISNWSKWAPILLDFNETASDPEMVAQLVWNFYTKNNTLTGDKFVQMITDGNFEHPIKTWVQHLHEVLPVFAYRFNHTPEFRVVDSMQYANTPKGPGGWDDLQYLFNMTASFQTPAITDASNPIEYILSKGMIRMITSFLSDGKPSMPWGEGKNWVQMDGNETTGTYVIDISPKMEKNSDSFKERMAFWNDISKKYFQTLSHRRY